MPQQHPLTPAIPAPRTRREALAAERAASAPTASRTRTATITAAAQPALRPLPTVAAAPATPVRSLRSRVLAAVPITGAAAAMALFTAAAALPAQATTGSAAVVSSVAPAAAGQSFTASGLALTVDRDGYTITKPAPKPVITKTAPASQAAPTGATPASTKQSVPTTTGGTIVNTGIGDIRWPVAGTITVSSPFGPRSAPCATCSSIHQGADLTPGAGTPIGAVAAGTVRVSTTHPEYGQYVIIDHQIDGRLVSTLYAHMIFGSSPLRPGDTVAVGQLVGLVGNTGASTGAHLHLQVMPGGTTPIDPIPWLTANAGRTL
ncbi:M23 family metallopeptidase [Curtobacterium albidum]|uniref:M23 family metallopeptidase n=2 Tax=Curtobacterium TaxID=2034 RepID=A0A850DTZ2_9MICO|nr:M23 family metallopeptidase [Curtobacterium albidum]